MIEFDEQNRKLVLKLVYYGPALSGRPPTSCSSTTGSPGRGAAS